MFLTLNNNILYNFKKKYQQFKNISTKKKFKTLNSNKKKLKKIYIV